MIKAALLQQIIVTLSADLATLTGAARAAHAAATHEECLPDNKYDTTGLEASYLAQGQANRAAEIRQALVRYHALELRPFDEQTPIRLTALVTLEAENGSRRQVFLGRMRGDEAGRRRCGVHRHHPGIAAGAGAARQGVWGRDQYRQRFQPEEPYDCRRGLILARPWREGPLGA